MKLSNISTSLVSLLLCAACGVSESAKKATIVAPAAKSTAEMQKTNEILLAQREEAAANWTKAVETYLSSEMKESGVELKDCTSKFSAVLEKSPFSDEEKNENAIRILESVKSAEFVKRTFRDNVEYSEEIVMFQDVQTSDTWRNLDVTCAASDGKSYSASVAYLESVSAINAYHALPKDYPTMFEWENGVEVLRSNWKILAIQYAGMVGEVKFSGEEQNQWKMETPESTLKGKVISLEDIK